jgi:hypothetical protein
MLKAVRLLLARALPRKPPAVPMDLIHYAAWLMFRPKSKKNLRKRWTPTSVRIAKPLPSSCKRVLPRLAMCDRDRLGRELESPPPLQCVAANRRYVPKADILALQNRRYNSSGHQLRQRRDFQLETHCECHTGEPLATSFGQTVTSSLFRHWTMIGTESVLRPV